jgi:hypothetical protein
MDIAAHREKMGRLEDLRQRLDPVHDFELWMWTSMTAVTNGLNACLHHLKLTEPKPYYPHQIPGLYVTAGPDGERKTIFAAPGDVIHLGLPPFEGEIPAPILRLSTHLEVLEDLREPFVRGGEPVTAAVVQRCREAYDQAVMLIDQILSKD